MQIRLATINDLNRIWQLRLEISNLLKQRNIDQWQQGNPSLDTFKDDIKNREFFVIGDREIEGMIAIKQGVEKSYEKIYEGRWSCNKPYLTIHRLCVAKSHLGKGLANKLLLFAEKRAVELGINYIRIDTHKTNLYAIRLFESFNYKYCGRVLLIEETGDKKRLVFDKRL